jgi:hypothetical protein
MRYREIPWLRGRAVRVTDGQRDTIVSEADWTDRIGETEAKAVAIDPGSFFTTAGANALEQVYTAEPLRRLVCVFNDDLDANRVAWVSEGSLPPKPLWPGGPGYRSRTWRGAVFVTSELPTRIARCQL